MTTRKSASKTRGRARRSGAAIRDIAALAGVSVATVSRVLNGRSDVSAATRATVLRHIGEVGYVSNRSARALAGGRTGLIGLTVPHVRGAYFVDIVAGVVAALDERDARVVVCPTLHEHDREVSLLARLMHGTTDGGLLILPSESALELTEPSRTTVCSARMSAEGTWRRVDPRPNPQSWPPGRARAACSW